MNKKYILFGNFCTDGDYYLDLESWDLKDNGFDKFFEQTEKYDEFYSFRFETDDAYKVSDFLKNLMVVYRCSPLHHYLIKELYEMTDKILKIVFNDIVKEKRESISGNYAGTFIRLIKKC